VHLRDGSGPVESPRNTRVEPRITQALDAGALVETSKTQRSGDGPHRDERQSDTFYGGRADVGVPPFAQAGDDRVTGEGRKRFPGAIEIGFGAVDTGHESLEHAGALQAHDGLVHLLRARMADENAGA
jgi:hypothetical protein